MRIRTIIYFMLLFAFQLIAQSSIKITGKIVDAQSSKELAGANIIVESTAVGCVSDAQGRFAIENLLNGIYQVRVEYMGYETLTKTVRVANGQPAQVLFQLQPGILDFQDVAVSASRFSPQQNDLHFDIRLDRARIEQSRSANLARLLKGLPGVQITETGAAGSTQKISIRGSNSNQVLVFVDGVKMNDETTGEVDLSQIPVNSIESIQVKKGGDSALYGSGAIGGAVYISTIQNTEKRAGLTVTSGPFEYFKIEPHINGKMHNWVYTLSFQGVQSKGNYPYSYRTADDQVQNATRENADLSSKNVFARAGYSYGDHQFLVRAQHYSAVRGLPGKINYWTRYARSDNVRNIYNVDYRFLFNRFLFRVDAYWNQNKTENSNLWPEDAALVDRQYPRLHMRNTHTAAGGHAKIDFSADWYKAQFGVEVLHSSYQDENVLYPGYGNVGAAENQLYAAFMKQTFEYKKDRWKLALEPAVRFDYAVLKNTPPERIEKNFSPGIHAFASFGNKNRFFLKSGIHSAFRLPTFADLFYQDFRVQGKPDLLPEKSVNTEYGGGFSLGALSFQTMHFHYTIDDMIVWRLGSFEVFQPFNNDAEIFGEEYTLALQSRNKKTRVDASLTHLAALNKNKEETLYNKYLIYKPKNAVSFSLSTMLVNCTHSVQYRYNSKRFVTDANTVSVPEFHVWDWSATRSFAINQFIFNLQFEVLNIFNENYEIIRDMPLPGREWRVGLSLQYN